MTIVAAFHVAGKNGKYREAALAFSKNALTVTLRAMAELGLTEMEFASGIFVISMGPELGPEPPARPRKAKKKS